MSCAQLCAEGRGDGAAAGSPEEVPADIAELWPSEFFMA
jgi:hypothetical protein